MHFDGRFAYNTVTVGASVVIAVVAATSALWAAGHVRGFVWSIGASLGMGLAVSGMHYTGMAALTVHLHGTPGTTTAGSPTAVLAPMLIGPLAFLILAGVVMVFDPLVITGRPPRTPAEDKPGVPAAAVAYHQDRHPALDAGRGPLRRSGSLASRTPQNR